MSTASSRKQVCKYARASLTEEQLRDATARNMTGTRREVQKYLRELSEVAEASARLELIFHTA